MTEIDLDRLTEPPSRETRMFNERLEALLAGQPQVHEVGAPATRAARERGEGIFPVSGPLEGTEWREVASAAGRVRLTLPEGAPRGVFVHIHGGGWTLGAPEQTDAMAQAMARETGLAVVAPAYRLAPEHPWPACVEDCEAALHAVLAEWPELPVFIGGDSAGAHLAAVAINRLTMAGLAKRIAGAALVYGCFDLRLTPSMANWGPRNLVLSSPTVEWFVDNLTGGDRSLRSDPALSPLLGPVEHFPPCLLQVGTADPLIDDTLFMTARLAAAGVPARLRVYPGGVHAFDAFAADLALARDCLTDRFGWLKERLGG